MDIFQITGLVVYLLEHHDTSDYYKDITTRLGIYTSYQQACARINEVSDWRRPDGWRKYPGALQESDHHETYWFTITEVKLNQPTEE